MTRRTKQTRPHRLASRLLLAGSTAARLAQRMLVLGRKALSEGVERAGDLLRRLKQGQVPDVAKHLQNGARDPGQKLALKGLDGVNLVVLARNHPGRHIDVTNRLGNVLKA